MELTRNDGFVFVQYLLELDFVEAGIDIGHEGSEIILMIGKRTQDDVPLTDTAPLERTKHAVSHLGGSESDGSLTALKSHLFPQLPLSPQEILPYDRGTLMAVSISRRLSGDDTTLMKIFLSVSSFWPKE